MSQKRPAGALVWAALAFLTILPFSLGAAPSWDTPQEPEHAQEEGPLHENMESLKDHMRALRKTLGDPAKRDESTQHAQAMLRYTLASIAHVPEAPEGMSRADVVQWRVDFQRKLVAVCDHLLQMELALAQDRHEDAKNLYRSISDIKKEGHDTYDPDEE